MPCTYHTCILAVSIAMYALYQSKFSRENILSNFKNVVYKFMSVCKTIAQCHEIHYHEYMQLNQNTKLNIIYLNHMLCNTIWPNTIAFAATYILNSMVFWHLITLKACILSHMPHYKKAPDYYESRFESH